MENINVAKTLCSGCKQITPPVTGRRTMFARATIKNQELMPMQENVLETCTNFGKSALPQRIMFYSDREWKNFPMDLIPQLIDAFKSRRSVVEVTISSSNYVVDFLKMRLINLENGSQQSVAWIDESNKCFFPKYFFDVNSLPDQNEDTEMKLEIDVSVTGSSDSKDSGKIELNLEKKEVIAENGVPCLDNHPKAFGFDSFGKKLVAKLEPESEDYITVRNTFLKGFHNSLAPNAIIGIYRHTPSGCSALSRLQSFEKQIEITKKYRGDANVRRAWHGSSGQSIVGILRYGFGMNKRPFNEVAYGTGIYLAPEDCSHASAKSCDVDENGVQNMMLCQVIMGNMELVQPGSKQFHPSSEKFDCGVDDLQNPKIYVVWSTHMNTHICPEYVISFKAPLSIREQFNGPKLDASRTVETKRRGQQVKLPTSPWLPLPLLITVLQNNISSQDKDALNRVWKARLSKLITREELIKLVRMIVGDRLLRSTLMRYHFRPPVRGGVQIRSPNGMKHTNGALSDRSRS